MKLCIVTPGVVKGDGQSLANYEIVWEAIRRGHHVTLLSQIVAPELQQNSQVNWISISLWLPTELLHSMLLFLWSTLWLLQHRSEFDLVQVNGSAGWASGSVNMVNFVHSAWLRSPAHTSRVQRGFYGAYQWLYTVLHTYLEKQAFHRAKVVVAVSEKIRKELVDIISVPKERTRVIFNGVNLHEFSPSSADRKKLGLPEGVTLGLFVGDIRLNRKNLDTVLHALVQVPDLHLAIVGATAGSPYPQLAASLGLSERVYFLGYRRDVAEIMRAADLFVFPSRYEACALVLLEAMASGLPIITAATAGGAEIVTPASGIVLPDPEDTQALVEVLKTLTSNPQGRHQMGQAARAIAEQYSWASVAQSYMDLFEELGSSDYHRSHTHLSHQNGPTHYQKT